MTTDIQSLVILFLATFLFVYLVRLWIRLPINTRTQATAGYPKTYVGARNTTFVFRFKEGLVKTKIASNNPNILQRMNTGSWFYLVDRTGYLPDLRIFIKQFTVQKVERTLPGQLPKNETFWIMKKAHKNVFSPPENCKQP